MDKVIERKNLNNIIIQLMADHLVLTPTRPAGMEKTFHTINNPEEIDWGDGNCSISPKNLFFPQSEAVFLFEYVQNSLKIKKVGNHNKKRVLIGTRPCDANAMKLLDKVFELDYKDYFYSVMRQNTFIISLACNKPSDYCFCTSVDLSPFNEMGSDILLCDLGDEKFFSHIISDTALDLYKKFQDKFLDPTEEDTNNREKIQQIALAKLNNRFPLKDIKGWLDNNFDSPLWKRLAPECIGCGTCSFLCPTCHCFDLVDETTGYTGERKKNWDSCAFSNFTQMASHQPRSSQWQRFRQRIMHKLKYFVDQFSEIGCVGCGRCRVKCPVGIDILEVVERIKLEDKSSVPIYRKELEQ